ncbi:uncharacterized protein LOC130674169 [Microplitis mediator]|uniref:uncharacterized protein LOC130674169 n=1 Tax=Microplitis mediator TaxID=375433 RepID=UPI00255587C0|nr:uncharacterized protein LOC130674169 [Microplitis mediator]
MEEYVIVNYVKLSSKILVPEEWPIRGFKKLLMSLAEKMINNDDHHQIAVLRVNNLATMVVQYQDANETYYLFEKISDHELIRNAHIIDVIFTDITMINNPMEADGSTSGNSSAGTINRNSINEIPVNNYVICTEQNDHRTTHYIMPARQFRRMMRLVSNTSHAVDHQPSESVPWEALRYEALHSLARIGMFFIVVIIVVSKINYRF